LKGGVYTRVGFFKQWIEQIIDTNSNNFDFNILPEKFFKGMAIFNQEFSNFKNFKLFFRQ
jgi:hypothetical protein